MKYLLSTLALGLCVSCTGVNATTSFDSSFHTANNSIEYKSDHNFDRTIYIDAESGDDSANGLSSKSPIKSLTQLSKIGIGSNDQILMKGGQVHAGTIELIGVKFEEGDLIHISSYGDQKATLDFSGYPAGILIEDSSNILASDLKITADGSPDNARLMLREEDANTRDRIGVQIVNSWYDSKAAGATPRIMRNITLYNIDFYDIFYYNSDSPDIPKNRPCRSWSEPSKNYGYAIKGHNQAYKSPIENLLVENCTVSNVSNMGVQLTGNSEAKFNKLRFKGCNFFETGGPGYMFANCDNAVLENSRTLRSGSFNDPRKWGRGSGMWLMNCDGFLIQHNQFEEASGIGDSCGAHIDHGNRNVTIQYCYSKNNAGGFVEVLGKNRNCSYRYNISVDDGWRNTQRNDPEQSAQYWSGTTALTLGTILSVNGYTGGDFIGPYQTYIYNNTIVNTRPRKDGFINPFVFQVATSATGVLIANNIFYVPQQMYSGWSNHFKTKDDVKTIDEKAYDFSIAYEEDGEYNVRKFTDEEIVGKEVIIKNNFYNIYDPSHPNAENILPELLDPNGKQFGYVDTNALGGDVLFSNIDGDYAEDFIPRAADVVERGIEIEKLPSDMTSYGLSPLSSDQAEGSDLNLAIDKDFFGRPITKAIIGACVPQE